MADPSSGDVSGVNGNGAQGPTANGANGHGQAHGGGPGFPPGEGAGRRRLSLNDQQMQFLFELRQAQLVQHNELVTNLASISRQWLQQMADPRRNLNDECGYPANPTVDLFKQLYDREPVATRVVELMPRECWQAPPTVFEDLDSSNVTPFEQAWDELGQQLKGEACWHNEEVGSPIWEKLQRLDIVCGIGSFGVLLLGIDDGKQLHEPLDGVMVTHDGPMTDDEEQAIRKPRPRWEADDASKQGPGKGIPTKEDRLGAAPLSNQERLVVNRWRAERERDWVLNAEGAYERRPGQLDRRTVGRDRGFQGPSGREPSGKASPLDPAGADPLAMAGPDAVAGAFGRGSGSEGQHDVAGWGDALSGTDAQYFGNQFGASEHPAPPNVGGWDGPAHDDGSGDGMADEAEEQGEGSKATKGKRRPRLLFLRPYGEDMVQVVRYEWNIRNPRFGMPVMYRITLNDPHEMHSGVGLPMATVFVHWSRVIHVADNRRSSDIFGVPRLRPVLNPVLDVQKVRGAGAEGYYKSCFTGLQFVTHPQLGSDVFLDEQGLKDQAELFQNSLQRMMTAKGGSWQTIAPNVIDPTPQVNVNVEAICIALGCPVPVFKGYEIGEQASTNNSVEWNKRKHERQNGFLTPCVICPLADRLIQVGVLPVPGDAKSKVTNLRRVQPQAVINRITGGWLVTNVVRNAVPPQFRRPVASEAADGGATPAEAGQSSAGPRPGQPPMPTKPSPFGKPAPAGPGQGDDAAGAKGKQPFPPKGAKPGAKRSSVFISDGGYSVEWPDPESLGKKDKAAMAEQWTAALSAYVSGGCEAVMPFKEYLVNVWDWTEEQANEMIDAAQKLHEENEEADPLSMPRQVGGQEAAPEPGTKAFEDQRLQQEMVKKGIAPQPPGFGPKGPPAAPGQPHPGQPPPAAGSGKMVAQPQARPGAQPPMPGRPNTERR